MSRVQLHRSEIIRYDRSLNKWDDRDSTKILISDPNWAIKSDFFARTDPIPANYLRLNAASISRIIDCSKSDQRFLKTKNKTKSRG